MTRRPGRVGSHGDSDTPGPAPAPGTPGHTPVPRWGHSAAQAAAHPTTNHKH